MIKSKCRPQRIARPFSLEEDQKLLSLVSQHGDQDFELIASKMEGRTIKEVRYHYFKELNPNIDSSNWLPEEESLLIQLFKSYGENWSLFTKEFPNRTADSIKSKFFTIKSQIKVPQQENNEDGNLAPSREVDLENVLKPFVDKVFDEEADPFDNFDFELNLDSNPPAQQRKEEINSPEQQGDQAVSMKQLSCLQNAQPKFQSKTGIDTPICIDYCIGGYTIEEEIGKGTYSSVVRARKDDEIFAMKIIPMFVLETRKAKQKVYDEINIMRRLNHPNIVKYVDHFETSDHRYVIIIQEYCPYTLWDYVFNSENDPEKNKKIVIGIIHAIQYLHSNRVTHSDLKIENILIDIELNPKICDFGFAKCHATDSAVEANPPLTQFYAPPEAYFGSPINLKKADIYAIGIVFYMIATRDKDFYKVRDKESLRKRTIFENLKVNHLDVVQRLAARCTIKNPDFRPYIEGIVKEFLDE